jgi:hypothetical protein
MQVEREKELLEKVSDVHVLGIRSKTQVQAEYFKKAKKLLSVGCFCIGTNQIDLRHARNLGVPVFNAPHSNTLRAKPSDRNIRIIRVVFALILIGVIYFGFTKTTWEFSQIPNEALYILYVFPLIGIIRGIFDPGIMRKKLWKWTQVIL